MEKSWKLTQTSCRKMGRCARQSGRIFHGIRGISSASEGRYGVQNIGGCKLQHLGYHHKCTTFTRSTSRLCVHRPIRQRTPPKLRIPRLSLSETCHPTSLHPEQLSLAVMSSSKKSSSSSSRKSRSHDPIYESGYSSSRSYGTTYSSMSPFWTIGTLLGASSVALGAFGAHGLKQRIRDPALIANWGTAAQYQVHMFPASPTRAPLRTPHPPRLCAHGPC